MGRTISARNKEELQWKHDGMIYCIADKYGNELFDVYQDEFIEMCDAGILDEDTYQLTIDYTDEIKEKYGLVVIFTGEEDLEGVQVAVAIIDNDDIDTFDALNTAQEKIDFAKKAAKDSNEYRYYEDLKTFEDDLNDGWIDMDNNYVRFIGK